MTDRGYTVSYIAVEPNFKRGLKTVNDKKMLSPPGYDSVVNVCNLSELPPKYDTVFKDGLEVSDWLTKVFKF